MKLKFIGFLAALLIAPAMAADVAPSRAIPGRQTVVEQHARPEAETETPAVVESRIAEAPRSMVSAQPAATPSRAATVSRTAATTTGRESLTDVSRQAGRSARTEAASLNASAPMRRAGLVLRPTTAEVGGRAKILGTDAQTGSNVGAGNRKLTARAATTGPDVFGAEESAAATESCLPQYMDCMDQFCSVIDANQKRCSCSSRLQSYARVETAVKDANSQLNDVAQRIRYIGLSADEIRAIMKATEAELELQNTKDTTQSRKMLSDIEKLIRQPEAYVAAAGGINLDLDFNFDAGDDLGQLFSLESNNSSFSNLRGTELYNAAKKRCQNVLNNCKARGANISNVTGRYEMEIDKDCVAYEKGLEKMNQTVKTNVRSATQMLQQARLAVLHDNNSYDAAACIGALEKCMIDDMVCGADYSKCLDPTKRYIDENGSVVLGQNVATIRKMMTNYNNALIDAGFISNAWGVSGFQGCEVQNNDGRCIVKYLLTKIGMGDTNSGLCRPVLDKCRRYTYDSRDKYDNKNQVVVGYIQRAMVNIRAAQEQIISDYASNCMIDISMCYSKQISQLNTWSSNASVQSVYQVLKGACRNVALTCAYAVFAEDQTSCPLVVSSSAPDPAGKCIDGISDIFYQSMLCPENSFWVEKKGVSGEMWVGGDPSQRGLYVNEKCVCQHGYGVNLGRCELCPSGTHYAPSCNVVRDRYNCEFNGCNKYCPESDDGLHRVPFLDPILNAMNTNWMGGAINPNDNTWKGHRCVVCPEPGVVEEYCLSEAKQADCCYQDNSNNWQPPGCNTLPFVTTSSETVPGKPGKCYTETLANCYRRKAKLTGGKCECQIGYGLDNLSFDGGNNNGCWNSGYSYYLISPISNQYVACPIGSGIGKTGHPDYAGADYTGSKTGNNTNCQCPANSTYDPSTGGDWVYKKPGCRCDSTDPVWDTTSKKCV